MSPLLAAGYSITAIVIVGVSFEWCCYVRMSTLLCYAINCRFAGDYITSRHIGYGIASGDSDEPARDIGERLSGKAYDMAGLISESERYGGYDIDKERGDEKSDSEALDVIE